MNRVLHDSRGFLTTATSGTTTVSVLSRRTRPSARECAEQNDSSLAPPLVSYGTTMRRVYRQPRSERIFRFPPPIPREPDRWWYNVFTRRRRARRSTATTVRRSSADVFSGDWRAHPHNNR